MPKVGMEPLRRAAVVAATIEEIGDAGTLDVTVGAISKRAGMSSALAHHYFGGKEQIFLAAMRHILKAFGEEAAARLKLAETPTARLEAILAASFSPENFKPATISSWLNFYVLTRNSQEARRLLLVYQKRLDSNLRYALRELTSEPELAAQQIAALIDGLYIRAALEPAKTIDSEAIARAALHGLLKTEVSQ